MTITLEERDCREENQEAWAYLSEKVIRQIMRKRGYQEGPKIYLGLLGYLMEGTAPEFMKGKE